MFLPDNGQNNYALNSHSWEISITTSQVKKYTCTKCNSIMTSHSASSPDGSKTRYFCTVYRAGRPLGRGPLNISCGEIIMENVIK